MYKVADLYKQFGICISVDLLSVSMIIPVAVLLEPFITVLSLEVKVAVKISLPSSVSSFTTEMLTYSSVSLGEKVTKTALRPLKSATSGKGFNLCITVKSTMGRINVLPVAVPGEVLKHTETGCVVGASFTIRNLTTAPSASLTVYVMGSNCTTTAVKVQERYTRT